MNNCWYFYSVEAEDFFADRELAERQFIVAALVDGTLTVGVNADPAKAKADLQEQLTAAGGRLPRRASTVWQQDELFEHVKAHARQMLPGVKLRRAA